jgi:hypothetical protein
LDLIGYAQEELKLDLDEKVIEKHVKDMKETRAERGEKLPAHAVFDMAGLLDSCAS